MEEFVVLLLPAILALLLVRVLLLPVKLIWKLLANSATGFACLWLLNAVAAFTGVLFPMNAATVLISGFLGLPGIALLAILAVV